ncbi:hypothetical protein LCGC14_1858930 [marine sediment metagenome]|uniref:Uncharacterized protein n=1 Tax=marine sediment metagenome TaxID=412755 RepID=A0A0F9GWH2_9ZZZZ
MPPHDTSLIENDIMNNVKEIKMLHRENQILRTLLKKIEQRLCDVELKVEGHDTIISPGGG